MLLGGHSLDQTKRLKTLETVPEKWELIEVEHRVGLREEGAFLGTGVREERADADGRWDGVEGSCGNLIRRCWQGVYLLKMGASGAEETQSRGGDRHGC